MNAEDQPQRPDNAALTGSPRMRAAVMALLSVVLIGCLVYLLVPAAGGAKLVKIGLPGVGRTIVMHDALPWLILAVTAAVLGVGVWWLTERELASRTTTRSLDREAREAAEAAAADAEKTAEDVRQRLRETETSLEQAVAEHRVDVAKREGMVRAWRGEREWNRELRGQIERMQRAQGVLGRHDDVRRAVLELTMKLVDAEKGLLLSDRDTGGTDQLKMVCFSGFDNDPEDSVVAQRFAGEVIERDATVREDDPARVDAHKRTAADEEVRNLLAIPIYLSDDFSGVIVCANRDGGFAEVDDDVLLAVGDHAGAVLQNSRLHGDLRSAYLSTIRVLADAIELKDPELRGHCDDVSGYVLAVADRLGFDPQRREELIFASLLHDIGKLGISERILLKPAQLTAEERSVIQLHPRIGYQLVQQVPALQQIAPAVLHHHERFDGEGYPGRLRGDTIPLEARIISIADSFSAITSNRPYSPGRSCEEACAELERCAGGQFDPEVVRLFVEEVRRNPPTTPDSSPTDPEVEVHRVDGEFRLGAQSFGITDSLTLLYSHRHLHETARVEAQRAALQDRPFAVLVAELTNIEHINLTHGFAAGDEALQCVASAFQRVAPRCQGQAYRASGRRIALLGPSLDESGAAQTAEMLRLELLAACEQHAIAVSIGGRAWRAGDSGEDVIQGALAATVIVAAP